MKRGFWNKKSSLLIFSAINIVVLLILLFFMCVPFSEIKNIPTNITTSHKTIEHLNKEHPLGKLVSFKLNENDIISTDISGNINSSTLSIKVLGLPVKKVDVTIDDNLYYAIGEPVGFSLITDGVIVIGSSKVYTQNGYVDTLNKCDIKEDDVILSICGQKINKIADISRIINSEENKGKIAEILYKRNGELKTGMIYPQLDVNSKLYKLGLWVKDGASGVGTLTYVNKNSGKFGALGHAICNGSTKEPFKASGGDMYKCTVVGINKGHKGKPGEIKGLFVQGKNVLGEVSKNTNCGVFGTVNSGTIKLDDKKVFEAGGRLSARTGKAKIISNVDGLGAKEYDIEIIKTNYQNFSCEKSMVIKVTDKELLKKTGGIIQGMSGSPIIQNGKIIGAVTHVFVSDPTKGFGIYLDWMINASE